jgi:hypothetical protein
MDFHSQKQTGQKRQQLEAARAELEALKRQVDSFEAVVDAHLGQLLDQLSQLNAATQRLGEELLTIRERRLFGEELIRYLDGAPRSVEPIDLDDLPPAGLSYRTAAQAQPAMQPMSSGLLPPDIKALYRKLARRYHPDLARTDADRAQSNEQMAEVNRLYQAGDLTALMRLAGISLPREGASPSVGLPRVAVMPEARTPPGLASQQSLTEQEALDKELKDVRQEMTRLSQMPIVRLSLDVKLARHQQRDLLGEIAAELRYKIARKTAERDYLRAQINASIGGEGGISSTG